MYLKTYSDLELCKPTGKQEDTKIPTHSPVTARGLRVLSQNCPLFFVASPLIMLKGSQTLTLIRIAF